MTMITKQHTEITMAVSMETKHSCEKSLNFCFNKREKKDTATFGKNIYSAKM